MKNTKLLVTALLSLSLVEFGCGKATTQSNSSTSASSLAACLNASSCGTVDNIDAKVADANKSLIDADAAMSKLSVLDLFTDPTVVTGNSALSGLSDKLKSLITKIDDLEAKLNSYLVGLDPVRDASIIADVQKAVAKLEKVKTSFFAERDKMVAKIDAFIAKVQAKIDALNPLVQLVLSKPISKVMNFLDGIRNSVAILGS